MFKGLPRLDRRHARSPRVHLISGLTSLRGGSVNDETVIVPDGVTGKSFEGRREIRTSPESYDTARQADFRETGVERAAIAPGESPLVRS